MATRLNYGNLYSFYCIFFVPKKIIQSIGSYMYTESPVDFDELLAPHLLIPDKLNVVRVNSDHDSYADLYLLYLSLLVFISSQAGVAIVFIYLFLKSILFVRLLQSNYHAYD
jgi:hypothetical protein